VVNKKGFFARLKWQRSQKQANNAVNIFAKHGLGFSISSGVVGDTAKLTKKELKAVNKASLTMRKNNAGYYRTKKSFNSNQALHSTRNIPLNLADYKRVQKKSAELFFSSSHLRAPIKFLQRTLFDARLAASPNRRRLGITTEDSQEWAAKVEAEWRTDKKEKSWDYTEQNDYSQLSDIALLEKLSIGEFFAIRRSDVNLPSGYSIQLISPFQVSSPYFSFRSRINYYDCSDKIISVSGIQFLSSGLKKGNYINCGIEYNSKDKEVAIYVSPAKYSDGWTRIPVINSNGFQQVLHGFIQQQSGQKRGMPESAMAYHEFMDIRDLQMFELESAKINATIAGTVTSDSNAQPNGKTPMGDVGIGWGNPLSEEESTDETKDTAIDPHYSVRKVDQGGFIVQNFTPGYKYQANDTRRPNVNNAIFIEKELEYIYPSAYGLSLVVTRSRYDGSYNASKGAIDNSWKNGVEYHLKQFSSDWHIPNYKAWLTSKVAKGQIVAIGYQDSYLRAAWQSMNIITPPKPSLNPLQEARASTIKVDQGFSNRELESQQLTGTSAEENAERLTHENEMLKTANDVLKEEDSNA